MTTIRDYKQLFTRQGWMTRQQAAVTLRHADGSNIERILDAANVPTVELPYEHGTERNHSRMFWGPCVRQMALAAEARRIGLFDVATMRRIEVRATAADRRKAARKAQKDADIKTLMGVAV